VSVTVWLPDEPVAGTTLKVATALLSGENGLRICAPISWTRAPRT